MQKKNAKRCGNIRIRYKLFTKRSLSPVFEVPSNIYLHINFKIGFEFGRQWSLLALDVCYVYWKSSMYIHNIYTIIPSEAMSFNPVQKYPFVQSELSDEGWRLSQFVRIISDTLSNSSCVSRVTRSAPKDRQCCRELFQFLLLVVIV